jgi:hypothetical protein
MKLAFAIAFLPILILVPAIYILALIARGVHELLLYQRDIKRLKRANKNTFNPRLN